MSLEQHFKMSTKDRMFNDYVDAANEVEVRLRTVESGVSRIPALTLPAIHNVFPDQSGGFSSDKQSTYAQVVFSMGAGMPTMRIRIEEDELSSYYSDGAKWYAGTQVDALSGLWKRREIKWQYYVRDNAEYPTRLSLAIEQKMENYQDVVKVAVDHFDPCTAQQVINTINYYRRLKLIDIPRVCSSGSLNASFRYIQRHTTETEYKCDISLSRRVDSYIPSVYEGTNETIIPPYEYEIEFELLGNNKGINVSELEKVACTVSCDLLWGRRINERSPFPSLPDIRASLTTFNTLRQIVENKTVPKAVPTKDIFSMCGTTFYTNKADGVTAYLVTVWSSDGKELVPYVITPDAAAKNGYLSRIPPMGTYSPIPANGENGPSLLIGELVYLNNKANKLVGKPRFLAFDALVINNKSVISEELEDRLEFMRKEVIEKLQVPVIGIIPTPKAVVSFVIAKEIIRIPDPNESALTYQADDKYYDKDGIIFMGSGPIYSGPKRTRPRVLKWKEAKDQTVDLLVHYSQTKNKLILLCGDTFEVPDNYGKNVSIYTYKTLPIADDTGIKLNNVDDDTIVEFRVDVDGHNTSESSPILVPVRTRVDKTARYHRALRHMSTVMRNESARMRATRLHLTTALRRKVPGGVDTMRPEWLGVQKGRQWNFPEPGANNKLVFIETMKLAHNPLTLSNIFDNASIWRSSYFRNRTRKPPSLKAMVFANNKIKEYVMKSVMNMQNKTKWKVLDLGCGEGNDLPRWFRLRKKIEWYLGVDIDVCGIVEARRRLRLSHYRSFHKKATYRVGQFLPPETDGSFVDGSFVDNKFKSIWKDDAIATEDTNIDLVTCFFAIHYALAEESGLVKMLTRVKNKLGSHGRFAISFMDAERVLMAMEGSNSVEHNDHYRIGTTPQNSRQEESKTANDNYDKWYVYMVGIGKEISEPRLTYTTLIDAADTVGLEIDREIAIREVLGGNTDKGVNEYCAKHGIHTDEKRLMGFYRHIVFKKKSIEEVTRPEQTPLSKQKQHLLHNEEEPEMRTVEDLNRDDIDSGVVDYGEDIYI